MRVVKVRRISRDTEQSSALAAQDEALSDAAAKARYEVVGDVEDSCVSGAVNLDKRPSLGEWLREPLLATWDALMFTTQDRITRDDLHWWGFVAFLQSNKKNVIVLDDPGLDLTTPNGRVIAGFKAAQAANYRNDVITKKHKQLEHYRAHDFWPGGQWPFGYRAERLIDEKEGKPRFRLIQDPVTAPLVREAYDRMVNKGWRLNQIARDWNKRGIDTPRNHQIRTNLTLGREGVSTKVNPRLKWQHTMLKAILTRPTIMGLSIQDGKVRQRNGLPVQWAKPIVSKSEFDKLQAVIATNGFDKLPETANPMTGLVYCWCGEPMHSSTARNKRRLKDGAIREHTYYYMRCRSIARNNPCEHRTTWPLGFITQRLEAVFLEQLENVEIEEKTFIPGKDHTDEIANLRQGIDNLAQHLVDLPPGGTAANSILTTMREYEAQLVQLEAEPLVADRWEVTGTGLTFGQRWAADHRWDSRFDLLHKLGIRLYLGGDRSGPMNHFISAYGEGYVEHATNIAAGKAEFTPLQSFDGLATDMHRKFAEEWARPLIDTQTGKVVASGNRAMLPPLKPYSAYPWPA